MNTRTFPVLVAAAVLSACAATPAPRGPAAPAAPANLAKVYFYPQQGQSEAQQDRDRYDCHLWAVNQTGFDPTRRIAPREHRATVVPARDPNATIAATGVAGALIGATVADRGEAGKGALVGAVTGSLLGAVAASAENASQPAATRTRGPGGRYEQEAAGYRRAMSACLTGRGYSVR
jgi:hypothetical protein